MQLHLLAMILSHSKPTGEDSNSPLNFYPMTIHQYLERKYFRLNTTAKLENGKMYRLVNGRWMTQKEFDRIFPLPSKVGKPLTNLDKNKNSLL